MGSMCVKFHDYRLITEWFIVRKQFTINHDLDRWPFDIKINRTHPWLMGGGGGGGRCMKFDCYISKGRVYNLTCSPETNCWRPPAHRTSNWKPNFATRLKCLRQSEAMQPSRFSDQPEKHKLGRGQWVLASCQVSANPIKRFQRRIHKCLIYSEARAAILFFSDQPEKHKLCRGHWVLASFQVSENSKCISQREARAAVLLLTCTIGPKTQTW